MQRNAYPKYDMNIRYKAHEKYDTQTQYKICDKYDTKVENTDKLALSY